MFDFRHFFFDTIENAKLGKPRDPLRIIGVLRNAKRPFGGFRAFRWAKRAMEEHRPIPHPMIKGDKMSRATALPYNMHVHAIHPSISELPEESLVWAGLVAKISS